MNDSIYYTLKWPPILLALQVWMISPLRVPVWRCLLCFVFQPLQGLHDEVMRVWVPGVTADVVQA